VSGAGDRGVVLALDSATRSASAALRVDGRFAGQEVVDAASRASSELMPAVDRLLRRAVVEPGDVSAVVVGAGPGSFTGLRIAAATAKGIVAALGVPLFAYSSLLAEASAHRGGARTICALFDARNGEVYAGCWRFGGGGVEAVLEPAVGPVHEVLARFRGMEVLYVGEGAALYRAGIEDAEPGWRVAGGAEESPAAALLWLAEAVPGAGRVDVPAAWEPAYLRAAGAERIAAAGGAA
jgi:tRNA threonylcarbamoyladenosine biosynthesis protein TsaB